VTGLVLVAALVTGAAAVAGGAGVLAVEVAGRGAALPGDTRWCAEAARHLRDVQRMEVEVVADSLNDWRTRQRLPSCSITAAGATRETVQREATRLYERLREAGWSRSPDPRDAPGEASLRYRHGEADCLFNVNRDALLFTDAETAVLERLQVAPGETRYHVFVMCVAAQAAAPQAAAPQAAAP
jgi:hypothetical protein